ncbi:type II CAAX prenyl endopeptidase Rce1 family protein [Siphonobacter sp. SORGH_AS_1065]|uniref:CPBP family glutamic-type intramembrane protease n=1 Tax=Siphonobacter sp. SORGH_AS_1065 TaxID=3041795 RepID=UPI002785A752|nr:hypothetical protein [Siphonobacter sp. SORGH_AS_1065]
MLNYLFLIIKLICLILITGIISSILISNILSIIGINSSLEYSIPIKYQDNKITFFLIVVILGPIWEEIAFRLPLIFTIEKFLLSTIFITYYVISKLLKSNTYSDFFYYIFIISLCVYYSNNKISNNKISNNKISNNKIYSFFKKYRKITTVLYSILFGIFHINNYKISFENIYIIPIITLPQTLNGIILSYIRIKYGVYFSIFIHSTYNLLTFILT